MCVAWGTMTSLAACCVLRVFMALQGDALVPPRSPPGALIASLVLPVRPAAAQEARPNSTRGRATGRRAAAPRMAAAGQLTALLQAAQSADAGVRTQAEQQLAALQQQNFSELLVSLSAELADGSKPVDARRLAGLILKNTLDAKEAARKARGAGQGGCDARAPPPDRGGGARGPPAAAARRRRPPPVRSPPRRRPAPCRPSWCSSGWAWMRA